MKKTQIPAGMRALAGQIQKIKDQQKRLGLFCEDRELLSCPRCDIEEDVTRGDDKNIRSCYHLKISA